MAILRLPIDTKSLYLNIKNDNLHGHTATVATPLKQGKSYNSELGQILQIKDKRIDLSDRDGLIHEFVKNSKSQIVIREAFAFDKIKANGLEIDTKGKSFCIFIKEEVDSKRAQCGRLKVHYPQNLKYEDVDIAIDNKSILLKISESVFGYSLIVRAFEYDTKTGYLNFDILIVGENQIPYSKVFINEKGVGDKFTKIFNESADDYDFEIVPLRKKYGEDVDPSTYDYYLSQMRIKATELVIKEFEHGFEVISDKYPYALFDIRYRIGEHTKYIILRFTATNLTYFNVSIQQKNFINNYYDDIEIFVVTNILSKPVLKKYQPSDLSNMKMLVNSIKYMGGNSDE